jgi:hypothetical protein
MPKEKQRHREQRRSSSDPKPVIAALFEQSGEIAPVDFRRFGMRAGEIIARGAQLSRRRPANRFRHCRRRPDRGRGG